jgi:ketosteroid isomerase-like protein
VAQENEESDRRRDIEVIRAVYSRWELGDFTSWEAFADDYIWVSADEFESGEYTGLAEISASWRTWLQAWDGFGIEAEEVVAGSDGRYVVMQLFRGTGKTSGLSSEERSAAIVTMRDGQIVRLEGFWDYEAALRAAGVEGR